jgi:hypothetical protein
MDPILSSDMSVSEINMSKDDKTFYFLIFIIICVFIIIVVWNNLYKNRENMSGGTVAQMFAQDSQDVYLKGNVDKLATGNFTLMFNQPTRQANTYLNRGSPLYSVVLPDTPMNPTKNIYEIPNDYTDKITGKKIKVDELTFTNPVLKLDYVLPNKIINEEKHAKTKTKTKNETKNEIKSDNLTQPIEKKNVEMNKKTPTLDENILPSNLPLSVVGNSNPYELGKVAKQVAQTTKTAENLPQMTQWTPENYLFQAYMDNSINNKNCIKDPGSCTAFYGTRLADGFVQSTKAVPYVNLDDNIFYPDSYVGSYYNDNMSFNIMKPYPFMPDNNIV